MRQFLKEVFSDIDGRGSFSRLASIPLVLAVTFITVLYVVKTGKLPTLGEAEALGAIGGFLYFGNQVKGVTAAIRGQFGSQDPPKA